MLDLDHLVDETLSDRIKGLWERSKAPKDRIDWKSAILELATCIADLKRRKPAYTKWFDSHGIVIKTQDRIALAGMGENPDLTKQVLDDETISAKSCQWLWKDHIKPKITTMSSTPNPFEDQDRGEEVNTWISSTRVKKAIARALKQPYGNDLWGLILTSLDSGILARSIDVLNGKGYKISLSLLIHRCDKSVEEAYNLTSVEHLQEIRDLVLPAVIESKSLVLKNPQQLGRIINKYRVSKNATPIQRSLKPGEEEIIMFGRTVWPTMNDLYSYSHTLHAVWQFERHRKVISSPVNIRFITRPFEHLAIEESISTLKSVIDLVHHLCGLMEENPTGICQAPPEPNF